MRSVEMVREPRAVRVGRGVQRVFAAVTPKLQDFHRHQWANLTSDEVDTLHGLLAKALWGQAA